MQCGKMICTFYAFSALSIFSILAMNGIVILALY